MSGRYEPGPTGDYGSGGIARQGMDERYSTALWRDNPAAFWLHPEGPLSDTAPADYFLPAPQFEAGVRLPDYASMGLAGYGIQQRAFMSQLQAAANYANGLSQYQGGYNAYGLGALFGFR